MLHTSPSLLIWVGLIGLVLSAGGCLAVHLNNSVGKVLVKLARWLALGAGVRIILSFLATKYGYKAVTAGEILTSLTEAFRGGAGNTLTAL